MGLRVRLGSWALGLFADCDKMRNARIRVIWSQALYLIQVFGPLLIIPTRRAFEFAHIGHAPERTMIAELITSSGGSSAVSSRLIVNVGGSIVPPLAFGNP